jgi:ATP-dependent DNA helicase RecQ
MRIHQHEKTQRSRLIHRCLDQGGDQIMRGLQCTLDQISHVAGLTNDQTRRVLSALNGEVLTWDPPRSSGTVTICNMEQEKPEGDFEALKRKHRFDLTRLAEVIDYTRAKGCRQKTIIGYFGQDMGRWTCGVCDNCGGSSSTARELGDDEKKVVTRILDTICDLEGRFGRTRIAEILAGEENDRPRGRALDERPDFGKLVRLSVREIMRIIGALEKAGLIETVGDAEYPTIDITAEGIGILDGKRPCILDMPAIGLGLAKRAARKTKAKPKREKETSLLDLAQSPDEHLLADLTRLRGHLAAQRKQPPFRILPNAALEALARERPLTPEEAVAKIKGVGPTKARTIIPKFLDIIQNYRSSS